MPEMQDRRSFLESLIDLQVPGTIKFSPNAQQMVYSTTTTREHKKSKDKPPTSTLWLADTGKPDSSHQLTSGLFKDHSPCWHPDGHSIAFISDRPAAGKKWAIYILHLRDGVAEGEAYPITDVENEQKISILTFHPNGESIAWTAADQKTPEQKARDENGEDWEVWGEDLSFTHLWTVSIATKEVRRIKLEQDRHVVGFDWNPDGRYLAVVHTASPRIEEPFVTGSEITIATSEGLHGYDMCHVIGAVNGLSWANDGKLYFWSDATPGKTEAGNAVYAISSERPSSPSNGKPGKVAFGVENDVVALSKVAGEVVASVEHCMESRLYLLPDRLLYSSSQEIKAFDVAHSTDSDEILIAIATSDINHPDEVFTTTASGSGIVQLSNHGAAVKGREFGTCTRLTCPLIDSKLLLDNIFLSPPSIKGAPSKPLPTVVLIHGGPFSRIVDKFNGSNYFWTPYLLSLGYGILLPNYRGGRGKGEDFATTLLGKWDYEDVIAATQHAIESGYADKDRLIVGGSSHGGFLAYLCSVRNGDHGFGWKYKASIPVSGVSDNDTMSLTSFVGEMPSHSFRASWKSDKHDTQNRNASALWRFHAAVERSRESAEMVVPPMLILHGERDPVCPVTQAWGMRKALMSEGLPFEMVTYPRQGHHIQERRFWIDMAERIARWCETYIGPGEQSIS